MSIGFLVLVHSLKLLAYPLVLDYLLVWSHSFHFIYFSISFSLFLSDYVLTLFSFVFVACKNLLRVSFRLDLLSFTPHVELGHGGPISPLLSQPDQWNRRTSPRKLMYRSWKKKRGWICTIYMNRVRCISHKKWAKRALNFQLLYFVNYWAKNPFILIITVLVQDRYQVWDQRFKKHKSGPSAGQGGQIQTWAKFSFSTYFFFYMIFFFFMKKGN